MSSHGKGGTLAYFNRLLILKKDIKKRKDLKFRLAQAVKLLNLISAHTHTHIPALLASVPAIFKWSERNFGAAQKFIFSARG